LLYSFSPDLLETATALENTFRPAISGALTEANTARLLTHSTA